MKIEIEDSAFRQKVLELAREAGFEFFWPSQGGQWLLVPRKFSEEQFHWFAALVLANLAETPRALVQEYRLAVDRFNAPMEPTTDAGGEG